MSHKKQQRTSHSKIKSGLQNIFETHKKTYAYKVFKNNNWGIWNEYCVLVSIECNMKHRICFASQHIMRLEFLHSYMNFSNFINSGVVFKKQRVYAIAWVYRAHAITTEDIRSYPESILYIPYASHASARYSGYVISVIKMTPFSHCD